MNELKIGELLDGRYKITQPLSRGSFGCTFLAEDTKLPQNPLCVVKQLQPKELQPEFLAKAKELFDREAEALELLGKHDRIPRLLAHLKIDNDFYLIQEYIAGKTLAEEFNERSPKTEPEAIAIISELLQIVAYVHEGEIIHRDIKPSNIIRSQIDRRLVLIDFGAVMEFKGETLFGTIIGTPGYISQEQSMGRTGYYSDIYAVGIVGIQALTGINPNLFPKDGNNEIIWQDKATISDGLQKILTKMVKADKSDRYTSATAALQDLNRLGSGENETASTIKRSNLKIDSVNRSDRRLPRAKPLLWGIIFLTTMPLFWWLKGSFFSDSNPTLSLNGKTISQELNPDNLCQDSILETDIYCQKYTFQGEGDREIIIEMNSNDFDPFLVLQQPNGEKLEVNGDRSVDNSNARIQVKLPSSGKYTAIARTTYPGESGEYTLRARYD